MAFLVTQGQPGMTQPSAYHGVLSESSENIIGCVMDLLTAQGELPGRTGGILLG